MAIRSQDFEAPQQYARSTGNDVQTLIDAGTRAYDGDDLQLAVAKFSAALRLSPKSPAALYGRALVYFDQGHNRPVIADCNSALAIDRKNSRCLFLRGDARFRLQEYTEAEADIQLGLQYDPEFLFGWQLLGCICIELQEFDEALEALTRVIESEDQYDPAWYQRGRAYYYLDEHNATERDLNRAIELDPDCVGAFEYRGRHRLNLGQYDQAAADFDRVVAMLPEWYGGRIYRAEALLELKGRADDALADVDLAITHIPDWVYAYKVRAQVHAQRHDYSRALADLNRAIELDNEQDGELLQMRGQAWLFEGDYVRAGEDLRLALKIDPENEMAFCIMAELHYEQKQYAEALASAAASFALNPNDPDTVEIRARVQAKLKNRKAALADVERLFQLKGDNDADAYIVRADCYFYLGDYPAAYQSYERSIDLEPEDPENINQYACALASCPDATHRDAKRALQLIDKALALENNPNSQDTWCFRDTKAIALAADGQFDRAVVELDEVLKYMTDKSAREESVARRELFLRGRPFVET